MRDVLEPELIVKQPTISSLQMGILRRMKARGPLTAYALGASIGTLYSMQRRGLVWSSISHPTIWRITEEGCQLIQSKEQGE